MNAGFVPWRRFGGGRPDLIQTSYEARVSVEDPRDLPAYTYAEAGRILAIPASTIRAWAQGQAYRYKARQYWFESVLELPDPGDSRLSYNNLIEAYSLRALRTVHQVALNEVRESVRVASEEYGIPRLLIHKDMRAAAGEVFLERYGALISLGRGQQLAMKRILQDYLWRIEYDEHDLAASFYPLTRGPKATDSPKIIVLDPRVSFGRPIIDRRGIRTSAIFSRINAGETPAHVAEDYGLTDEEVAEAILFEAAA